MRRRRRLVWVSLGAAVIGMIGAVLLNGRALIEEWHIRGLERSLSDGYASFEPDKNADFLKLVKMRSQRAPWHFLRRYQSSAELPYSAEYMLDILLTTMGADALPFLEGALKDPDPGARAWVASALRYYQDDVVHVEPLLKIGLHDREELVRRGALFACRWIGPSAVSALPEAIRLLKDPDDGVRAVAVEAVCAMATDPGVVIECVRGAVGDPSSSVRRALLWAVDSESFSTEERIGVRFHLLRDPSPLVRSEAAALFFSKERGSWPMQKEPRAYAAVLAGLRHADASTRAWSASLLFQAGPFAAVMPDDLEIALTHSEPLAREWAADCLGERGDEGVELLTRALGDASAGVRRKAASYLARRGKQLPAAEEALAAQLEDGDRGARIAAAAALLAVRPEDARALRILREGLAATDLSTRCYTLRQLRTVGRAASALRPELEGMLEGQPEEAEMLAREAIEAQR